MRWILAAATTLALSLPTLAEETRFPRAALVESSYHQIVPPLKAFLQTLKKLDDAAAFDAGQGMKPREDLDGLSAKQWLMNHIAPDFNCRRDFGGMCESNDPKVRFSYVFLSDHGWGSLGDGGPKPHTGEGLNALSLSFAPYLSNLDVANGDGESCVPAIAETSPTVDEVISGFLGQESLEAYDNFIGVYGRYRIRSAPSLNAPVVNGISSEVVFLPGPGETLSIYENDQNLNWSYVVPAQGPAGFIALEPFDVLQLSGVASPQLCVAMRDGRVVITAHAGAGD